MSTRDKLSLPFRATVHHFADNHIPQPAYLGLDIQVNHAHDSVKYCICPNNGSYVSDYYMGTFSLAGHQTDADKIRYGEQRLLDIIRGYAKAQNLKIQVVGLGLVFDGHTGDSLLLLKPPSLAARLWLELDGVPFIMDTKGSTLGERASAAVRKSIMWLSPLFPGNIPRISVGHRHEVKVDSNGHVHLVDLGLYEKTVSAETWKFLNTLADETRRRKLRLSFFNSTPQGGGVALMRHALIRLFRLLDIDAHWYVTKPKPEIFDITKRKFHNVLQGVAPPNEYLSDADKALFEAWSADNVKRYWGDADGPFRNSDVIIIDDPQVTGLIPHIKRLARSNTKLIYRSHIEIRADLIRESPEGPQATTWGYLWNSFVRHADLFVSHPVTNFIPDDLPRDRVVLMPATTDPLDGLNKEMAERDMTYYRLVFNRVCSDQGSKSVNWDRPYIVQIARFDPSKGIGDVLKSYKILREKIASVGNFSEIDIPQLVVCGHGSMDDPDGTIIYEQTYLHVQSDQFADINADIIIARVPPCDQLLNMILRGAYVALQLSHREGFEVKVTEALAKGVPVIAYQAGGIPLQIQHGRTGYLVPVGDTSNVASLLFELFSNGELRERMSIAAKETPTEEYWTVVNAINWLFLSNTLAAEGSEDCKPRVRIGDGKWVKEFWRDGANYSGPQPTTN